MFIGQNEYGGEQQTGKTGAPARMGVSVGICAYNEEKNIGRLLEVLKAQRTELVRIEEIIVVSSACHDETDNIVASFAKSDPRIKLIREPERRGKAPAINLLIAAARNDVCVLSNADIIPEEDAIEKMCLPFREAHVGMTGARVIPSNEKSTFIGFLCHFRWRMSHEVSLIRPVLGELVAFRKIVQEVPANTAADESSIEWKVKSLGYDVVYVPEAIFHNQGPRTLRDFISQRRRIYAGQLYLRKTTSYASSSMNYFLLIRAVFRTLDAGWRSWCWTPPAIALEAYCRLLGTYDFYVKKKNPYIWDMAATTKTIGNGEDLKSK